MGLYRANDVERRQYSRYQAKENVMAFDSKCFRRVENISLAGMRYVVLLGKEFDVPKAVRVGLLSPDTDTYIADVQCEVVKVTPCGSPDAKAPMTNTALVTVAFKDLSALQRAQLYSFIALNTVPSCTPLNPLPDATAMPSLSL